MGQSAQMPMGNLLSGLPECLSVHRQQVRVGQETIRHSQVRVRTAKKHGSGNVRNIFPDYHAPVPVKCDEVAVECTVVQGTRAYAIPQVHAMVRIV